MLSPTTGKKNGRRPVLGPYKTRSKSPRAQRVIPCPRPDSSTRHPDLLRDPHRHRRRLQPHGAQESRVEEVQHRDVRRAVDREHRAERRRHGRGRGASCAGTQQCGELVEEGADVGEEELEEVLSCLGFFLFEFEIKKKAKEVDEGRVSGVETECGNPQRRRFKKTSDRRSFPVAILLQRGVTCCSKTIRIERWNV